ncbi:SRPBCC family protein [Pseudonocardia spinosispora]|uniref:SRPBCC family protein n=1 Tax=Pseudonocardia spinosispora TaxID=103441 RepID=UPI00040FBDBE|nr:SRPBCC family protein [Pseudonocardia spinosispora]
MIATMTFDDLRAMLVDCAGLVEGVELDERHLDTELATLGYDSLALLEMASRIKQDLGVHIADEEVTDLRTPRLLLDRVNTALASARVSPAQLHSEHDIIVNAPAPAVFALLTDVSLWPVIFSPTVHTRLLERTEHGDRFDIWATAADGDVNTWTSRRTFDAEAGVITFAQDRDTPLFGFMGGSWTCEPRGDGRTRVVLGHHYNPSPDEPDAERVILRELDHNGTRELEALRVIADLPGDIASLLVSFTETVELAGPADRAHEFIWAADQWPSRLPHVAEVTLRTRGGNAQDLTMATRTPDGARHTTRSVRVGLPDRTIAYKQITLPTPLLGHSGRWEFTDGRIQSTHTALIDPVAAAALFGTDVPLAEVARRVRAALAANSLATMEHAVRFAELDRVAG